MDDAERLRRAQRREFIREHHPDRGGDPAEFLAGLRRFDAAPEPASGGAVRVMIVADQRWPVSAVTSALRRLRRRRRPRVR